MEKLLKNKWLMLLIAVVVLYIVWKKFGKGSEQEIADEDKAGAMGKTFCQCQGQPNGYCFNWSPWSDCCARKCVKKIHSTWD